MSIAYLNNKVHSDPTVFSFHNKSRILIVKPLYSAFIIQLMAFAFRINHHTFFGIKKSRHLQNSRKCRLFPVGFRVRNRCQLNCADNSCTIYNESIRQTASVILIIIFKTHFTYKFKFSARKTTSIIHYSSAVGDFIIHFKNPFLMNDEY